MESRLHVTLYLASRERLDGFTIPPARAFPDLISLTYSGVLVKVFVRRGESVGVESDVYDEVTPVPAIRDEEFIPEGTP